VVDDGFGLRNERVPLVAEFARLINAQGLREGDDGFGVDSDEGDLGGLTRGLVGRTGGIKRSCHRQIPVRLEGGLARLV
jgi:hypothetical protein